MVAALTRIFGVHNLALAEDVVQDAFCRALEVWTTRGVPDSPSAWLMTTAKNRALDLLRRDRTAQSLAPEMTRIVAAEWAMAPAVDEAFDAHTIRDEQLRMMFSCCHPRLQEDAQVALVLNVLCGFGAAEIASAFLVSRAAMEKRLSRGKQVLARAKRLFDLADTDFAQRLSAVQCALYLLFNEGYHGASAERAVRVELCGEAMRLTAMLREYAPAATPATNALAALMCLHAARLSARIDATGDLNPLADQDRSIWDQRLIADGLSLLDASATGDEITPYHLEAGIAATHAAARTLEDTNWSQIVGLYDRLMIISPSPVVALNRAIAVAHRDGADRGLEELHAIPDRERLVRYPFYPAALAELELRRGNRGAARTQFVAALGLARNATERRFLERRVASCE